jgi:hypothetical protein
VISASEAEYMELKGAVKDAGCNLVLVSGGVSSELGCCDKFHPRNSSVQEFECGECSHVNLKDEASGSNFNEPLSDDTTSTPSFPAYKNNGLTGSHAAFPKVKAVKLKSAMLSRVTAQSKKAYQSRHKWG